MKPVIIVLLLMVVLFVGGCIGEPEITLNPNCSSDSDCVLEYTKMSVCGPCDLSNEGYQCISPEDVEKLMQMKIEKEGLHTCKMCYPSPLLFRCICKDGECLKTADCENDMNCYSRAHTFYYSCVDNKCVYKPEKENLENYLDQETILVGRIVNRGDYYIYPGNYNFSFHILLIPPESDEWNNFLGNLDFKNSIYSEEVLGIKGTLKKIGNFESCDPSIKFDKTPIKMYSCVIPSEFQINEFQILS